MELPTRPLILQDGFLLVPLFFIFSQNGNRVTLRVCLPKLALFGVSVVRALRSLGKAVIRAVKASFERCVQLF